MFTQYMPFPKHFKTIEGIWIANPELIINKPENLSRLTPGLLNCVFIIINLYAGVQIYFKTTNSGNIYDEHIYIIDETLVYIHCGLMLL